MSKIVLDSNVVDDRYTSWRYTLGHAFMSNQIMFVMHDCEDKTFQFKAGTGRDKIDKLVEQRFTELGLEIQKLVEEENAASG